jgi:putative radical SAM enzyme (TIGR03279 family)
MRNPQGQLISACLPGSIAADLGLSPGDRLLAIDGQSVRDVFDYRLRQLSEQLLLTIHHQDGTLVEYDIEKDEDEDLGLEFDNPMLDECTRCHNRCIFCFIDQMPPGLRKTLYFKDDDLRMSFLNGNYVTLTNIREEELDRMIAYRFSPMNISVHTTDPDLRRRMMGNRKAGNILQRLQKLAAAGIRLNCQIVLCPEWNDGTALDKTLADLVALGSNVLSIALVPVGVTRYRDENKLVPLRLFTTGEAAAVVDTVTAWQDRLLAETGSRVVYLGDEFYFRAERPIPVAEAYEDYPQLENGVGMAALFQDTIRQILAGELPSLAQAPLEMAPSPAASTSAQPGTPSTANRTEKVLAATGTLAAPLLTGFAMDLSGHYQLPVTIVPVINDFFGSTVTVTGLLTGQDLVKQIRPLLAEESADAVAGGRVKLLLPDCLLKADAAVFLDDYTLQDVAEQLGIPVLVYPATAEGLTSGLAWLQEQQAEAILRRIES